MARGGPDRVAPVIGSAEFGARGVTATSSGYCNAFRRGGSKTGVPNFVMAQMRRNRR